MSTNIKCVGVIGTGTIGASWTGLFLSKGLQVLVSDPAPGAEKALASNLADIWPTLEEIGLAEGASLNNYRFVGASLEKYYDTVDFIQEVSCRSVTNGTRLLTSNSRMHRSGWTSRPNSSARLMRVLAQE
jgi:3-hydroxyacyl-CoA dehydrogenase